MKKTTAIYLVILGVIGLIAALLLLKEDNSTLKADGTDFKIEDTAAVTKIVLTERSSGKTSVLERKSPSTWIVDGQNKVKERQIDILLETIRLVDVKNPVPLAARDNVIKMLTTGSIKAEIYKGNEKIKTYYVGSPTPDELGTMMLVEGAEDPFITHIPGFNGYLTPRYIVGEKEWRTTEIYNLNPAAITEVTVEYPNHPEASFKLTTEGNEFYISPMLGDAKPIKMNSIAAKRYLAGFKGITFEQFSTLEKQEIDSVISSQPIAVVNVKSSEDNPPTLKLYYKPVEKRTKEVGEGNIDLDKYYGLIGERKDELVFVQQLVIGKLLPSYQQLAEMKSPDEK